MTSSSSRPARVAFQGNISPVFQPVALSIDSVSERRAAPTPSARRRAWAGLPVGRVLGVPIVIQPLWFVVVVLFTAGSGPTVHDNVHGLSSNESYAVALAF